MVVFALAGTSAIAQSVSSSNTRVQFNAFEPAISGDGRYVAYVGFSNTSGRDQVFVRDRTAQGASATIIASLRLTTNSEAAGACYSPALSQDGRHIAFVSRDSAIIQPLAGIGAQIYVLDRDADGNGIFDENVNGARRMIRASSRAQVDQSGNGEAFAPSISANGRYVAFHSRANDLVAGDSNGSLVLGADVFVHDRDADGNGIFDETGTNSRKTIRLSVTSEGAQANLNSVSRFPSISGDGRFVAFESDAINLVSADTNGWCDVFLHDRDADGNGVFDETAIGSRATIRISVALGGGNANGPSMRPAISADGRYVAYASLASNLIDGDTNARSDVFIADRILGTTRRASVTESGGEARGPSFGPSISADGRLVAFTSMADNLVSASTNRRANAYVFDRSAQAPSAIVRRVGTSVGGTEIMDGCGDARMASGAAVVAFTTLTRLTLDDIDSFHDVYANEFSP